MGKPFQGLVIARIGISITFAGPLVTRASVRHVSSKRVPPTFMVILGAQRSAAGRTAALGLLRALAPMQGFFLVDRNVHFSCRCFLLCCVLRRLHTFLTQGGGTSASRIRRRFRLAFGAARER